ncbi:MAG: prepilin-type N-terminal cleavage/methylation domain-containing protein [Gemmatimonadetes bacterium]|nr:prepilin-type N-terminal cleavage/methylation domain-containing protein [Gemmatimonadota bacterium]
MVEQTLNPPVTSRQGFTLVELVVALVILAVGILGLAGTTTYVVRQVAVAGMQTDRTAALQAAVERLRAMSYDSVTGSDTDTVGDYTVDWRVSATATYSKTVRILTTGPGYLTTGDGTPVLSSAAQDTFDYVLLKP